LLEKVEEFVDFEEEVTTTETKTETKTGQKGYVSINTSGFRDFLLKPELLRAVQDCGFEHPSEVQHQCIPQAILGQDVLCQAKSGMGKTAVFVLALLQQIDPSQQHIQAIIIAHTRELAFQITNEFIRFSKYLPEVKIQVFYGGIDISINKQTLKSEKPTVVVGTPGRVLQLIKEKALDISKIKHFVLDECDKMLEHLDMRKDIQDIFKYTPKDKQVMMFSATLAKDIRPVAKKFMQNPMEIYIDDDSKLTLHGLQQYFVKLSEKEKNRKLTQLLDALEFNQLVVFVRTTARARELSKLLNDCFFPSICIHSDLEQSERIKRYQQFKEFEKRILITTDLFGRGIDIERVNIVINYDMADEPDQYLHRVARAGRFGTKGLAISFIDPDSKVESSDQNRRYVRKLNDMDCLQAVQSRFVVKIEPLPEKIDVSTYMNA